MKMAMKSMAKKMAKKKPMMDEYSDTEEMTPNTSNPGEPAPHTMTELYKKRRKK